MPTCGNHWGWELSGDELPWSQLRMSLTLFLTEPTRSNIQPRAWLLSKAAESWQAKREVKLFQMCLLQITCMALCTPFMTGNKHLNESWSPYIWQWSFQQKPWACLSAEVRSASKLPWFTPVALRVVTVFLRELIISLPRCHEWSKRSTFSQKPFFSQ